MENYEYKRPSKAHISGIERKGLLFSSISIITFSMFLIVFKYFIKFINLNSVGLTAIIYTILLISLLLIIKKQRLWLVLGLDEPFDEQESMAWGIRSAFFLGLNVASITLLLSEMATLIFGLKALYLVEVFVISYFIITFGGIMLLNAISKRKINLDSRKNAVVFSIEIALLSLMNITAIGVVGYFFNIKFIINILVHVISNPLVFIIFLIGLFYHAIKFTNSAIRIANKLDLNKLNYNSLEEMRNLFPHKKLEAKYADSLVYSGWLREDKKWVKIRD